MDEILKTAVGQAPSLVVLVFLVRWGMAFMTKFTESRDDFIRAMHNEHLVARSETREAIRDNATATKENTRAIQDLRECIRQNYAHP